MKYIDTHSHLNLPQFADDKEEVLARMRDADVGTFTVGVSLETSKNAIALVQKHSEVLGAIIGVHPTDTDEQFDSGVYASLLNEHVVGVGECGFDYFRTPKKEVHAQQREVFEAQIAFAIEHDLPLMLHVRPSKYTNDAHEDALDVLVSFQKTHGDRVRGNAHFFTFSSEIARRYWDIGFTTAFPGVITFSADTHETVREAPLDMILSETDAPYAAPVPFRGQRCEPVHVIEIVAHIAELKQLPVQEVQAQLVENALRVFPRAASSVAS